MKVQIGGIIAALAAFASAVPAPSGAIAERQGGIIVNGAFNAYDLNWTYYHLQFAPYYTVYWATFGVEHYDSTVNTGSFYMNCLVLYDDRNEPADAAWYPCQGYPFDGSVEAQYYVNDTGPYISIKQKYEEDGEEKFLVGTGPVKGYPENFVLPYVNA